MDTTRTEPSTTRRRGDVIAALALLAVLAVVAVHSLTREAPFEPGRDVAEATRVEGVVTARSEGTPTKLCVDTRTGARADELAGPDAVLCGVVLGDLGTVRVGDAVVGWMASAPTPGETAAVDPVTVTQWLVVESR